MVVHAPQDVVAAPQAAIEELKSRKLVACAGRASDRTRELIDGSRELIARGRFLLAQWRRRRPGVRARLATVRRSPARSAGPEPASVVELPKAA